MSQDENKKSPDTSQSDFDGAAVVKLSHPQGSAAHNKQIQEEIRQHRPVSQANGLVKKSGLTN